MEKQTEARHLVLFYGSNRELTKNKHERVWTEAEMYIKFRTLMCLELQ